MGAEASKRLTTARSLPAHDTVEATQDGQSQVVSSSNTTTVQRVSAAEFSVSVDDVASQPKSLSRGLRQAVSENRHISSRSVSSGSLCSSSATSPFLVMPACRNLPPPGDGTLLGLWNLGNTCYANSVIQALYQCRPFRQGCIEELATSAPDGLLGLLAQLFTQMSRYKRLRKTGYVNPSKFIDKLRERNDIFRLPEHHDAHEFYSFVLNEIGDELLKKRGSNSAGSPSPFRYAFRRRFGSTENSPNKVSSDTSTSPLCISSPGTLLDGNTSKVALSPSTWLHDLFQGMLVYETRCLCCEYISRRQEPFFDIPVDVDAGEADLAAIAVCLQDKYLCDICSCLQEAERRLRFQRLPRVLTIHLKRFNFDEVLGNYSRLGHRVAFPVTFSFPRDAISQCSAAVRAETVYSLFGVVVHVGTSMTHGHYIACVRWNKGWWLLDDHNVKPTAEATLESFFGSADAIDGMKCGYLLFYEMEETTTPSSLPPRPTSTYLYTRSLLRTPPSGSAPDEGLTNVRPQSPETPLAATPSSSGATTLPHSESCRATSSQRVAAAALATVPTHSASSTTGEEHLACLVMELAS